MKMKHYVRGKKIINIKKYLYVYVEDKDLCIFSLWKDDQGDLMQRKISLKFLLQSTKEYSYFSTSENLKKISAYLLNHIQGEKLRLIKKDSLILSLRIQKVCIRNIDHFVSLSEEDPYLLWHSIHQIQMFFYNYFQFDFSSSRKLTLSSLAYSIYQNMYMKDEKKNKNRDLFPQEDHFLRQSYFGGRTEIIRNAYEKKEYFFYDINSCYAKMMKEDLPWGKGKRSERIDLWPEDAQKKVLKDFFGFALIEYKSPKDLKLPILPRKDPEKGLIFPEVITKERGVFFSEEIQLALSHGYEIQFIDLVHYPKKKIFPAFVDFLYNEIKEKSQDAFEKKFSKLLLNSLYGFFGLDPKKGFLHKEEYIKKEEISLEEKLSLQERRMNPHLSLYNENFFQKRKPLPLRYKKVFVSSAISSLARIFLWKTIMKHDLYDHLFYMDTDSLVLDCPLPSSLISSQLGAFKSVYSKKIKEALFINTKIYLLKFEDDSVKFVIRGYLEKNIIFDFDQMKRAYFSKKDLMIIDKNTQKTIFLVKDEKRFYNEDFSTLPLKIL